MSETVAAKNIRASLELVGIINAFDIGRIQTALSVERMAKDYPQQGESVYIGLVHATVALTTLICGVSEKVSTEHAC